MLLGMHIGEMPGVAKKRKVQLGLRTSRTARMIQRHMGSIGSFVGACWQKRASVGAFLWGWGGYRVEKEPQDTPASKSSQYVLAVFPRPKLASAISHHHSGDKEMCIEGCKHTRPASDSCMQVPLFLTYHPIYHFSMYGRISSSLVKHVLGWVCKYQ